MVSAFGTVAFVAAPWLVSLFVPSDLLVIAAGSSFLRIMALSWGGIGIQYVVVAALRASGKFGQAMAIALASQWTVQFPLAWLLPRHLHAEGEWWSFPASKLITAGLALAWFAKGRWKRHLLAGSIGSR